MTTARDIWAVVPVKDTTQAKQRLAAAVSPDLRRSLALAMVEDVLAVLAAVSDLGGLAVVTVDPTESPSRAATARASWPTGRVQARQLRSVPPRPSWPENIAPPC